MSSNGDGPELSERAFLRAMRRELWERLAERYEACREEATLTEWAGRSIARAPEGYTAQERLAWAVRSLHLVEELERLERIWRVVHEAEEADRRRNY